MTHTHTQQWHLCDKKPLLIWHMERLSSIVAFGSRVPKDRNCLKKRELENLAFVFFCLPSSPITRHVTNCVLGKGAARRRTFPHCTSVTNKWIKPLQKSSPDCFDSRGAIHPEAVSKCHSRAPACTVLINSFNIKAKWTFPSLSSARRNKCRNPSAVTDLQGDGEYFITIFVWGKKPRLKIRSPGWTVEEAMTRWSRGGGEWAVVPLNESRRILSSHTLEAPSCVCTGSR